MGLNFKNLWSKSHDARELVDGRARPEDAAAGELHDFLAAGGFDRIEHLAVVRAKKLARMSALPRLKKLRERIDTSCVDAAWLWELDRTIEGLKRGLGISVAADPETKRRKNRESVTAHRRRKKEQAEVDAAEAARRAALTPMQRLQEDLAHAAGQRDGHIAAAQTIMSINPGLGRQHYECALEWAARVTQLESELEVTQGAVAAP